MTTTPDARPVSDERLAELIDEYDQFNLLRPDSGFGRDTLAALRELQSLRAEAERLAKAHAVTEREACSRAEDAERYEARIASLEKDAGRYRWLRDARYDNDDWYVTGRLGQSVVSPLMEVELDAAIDAAMKERV